MQVGSGGYLFIKFGLGWVGSGQIFSFQRRKVCGNKYSNDKQQQQILNVGTEVFQDSENTQIHMGTGNISQIPDIYFVNEYFIQKT